MSKNNYSVYIHKFPNDKVYVGLTKLKPSRRWSNGNGYKRQYVYNAIEKYDWDNIKHIIVKEHLSAEEACNLEQELIEQYDSIRNGYNCTPGGEFSGGSPKYYDYKNQKYSIYEMLEDNNINKYNISYDCAKWRLLKGWSIEDTFDTPQPEKYNLYEYNGKQYNVYQLAEISNIGITPHGIQTRIRRGYSVEDAITKPLIEKTMYREYKDNYYTIDELVDKYAINGITHDILICRLQRGWDLERALTQPIGTKHQPFGIKEPTYKYNGKLYNSYELSQIHPELGLTSGDITNRINYHHWDIERAISQPLKVRDVQFEYNGKFYNSEELAKICIDSNMKKSNVTDRSRNGWTVEEIVNIPIGMTRKQYYKNLQ